MASKFLQLLLHPDELPSLLKMAKMAKEATRLPEEPNLRFCYDMLNKVSRSFAIVIQQLPRELRDAICVFYLVLRALDTVEDDMAIDKKEKVPLLRIFYKKCYDPKFKYPCGTKHYKVLMDEYPRVTAVFLSLKKEYQDVIADITRRMGEGMADFIESEVVSLKDWDQYCHYVAGLVGIGLSNLFAGSGLESPKYREYDELSNHMGLLLQKTNIIRDYLEDICEEPAPRMFWPKDVWKNYAQKLEDFKDPAHRTNAVQCLNHLITNALQHVPHCLRYMEGLRDPMIFRFCALPQIMAIATLALCYNNGRVFEGVVKMRRGLTAKTMTECTRMEDIYRSFAHYLDVIIAKAQSNHSDPMREATLRAAVAARDMCVGRLHRMGLGRSTRTFVGTVLRLALFLALALYALQGTQPALLGQAAQLISQRHSELRAAVPQELVEGLQREYAFFRAALSLRLLQPLQPLTAPLTAHLHSGYSAAVTAASPAVAAVAAVYARALQELQRSTVGPRVAAGVAGLWAYVSLTRALPDPIC